MRQYNTLDEIMESIHDPIQRDQGIERNVPAATGIPGTHRTGKRKYANLFLLIDSLLESVPDSEDNPEILSAVLK